MYERLLRGHDLVVITQPATDDIVLDCCRQLSDVVMPAVPDDTIKVVVAMLEAVLRNVAVRAGHEVAWMVEEIASNEIYAQDVLAAIPDAADVSSALASLAAAPRASLHLVDMVATYRCATDALASAVAAATSARRSDLVELGIALLDTRAEREHEVRAGWTPIGR